MPTRVQIDDRGLMGKLRDLAAWKNESIGEITRRHARTCCVYLANFTQPYGDGLAAKRQGEKAIEKDIRQLWRDMDALERSVRAWKRSQWQQALLEALSTRDLAAVLSLLRKSNLAGRIVSEPSAATHKKYRNSRGRVRTGGYFEIVQKASALQRYIRQRQMMVGFAKSVWSTAASRLEVTLKNPGAGFPAWVRRHRAPARVMDRTNGTDDPYVNISSSLVWMDKVLSPANIGRAIIAAKQSMLKYIEMTWRGEVRRRFSARRAA